MAHVTGSDPALPDSARPSPEKSSRQHACKNVKEEVSSDIFNRLENLVDHADQEVMKEFFDDAGRVGRSLMEGGKAKQMIMLLRKIESSGESNGQDSDLILDDAIGDSASDVGAALVTEFMTKEQKVRTAYRMFKDIFPSQIWLCCKRLCFASIVIDHTQVRLLEEILLIHEHAEKCHAEREMLPMIIEKRRKGVGKSSMVSGCLPRSEREHMSGEYYGTRKNTHLHEFATFVKEVLPFLYGKEDSPRGTPKPSRKLCIQAICCLLGLSRNFLYNRKVIRSQSAEDFSEDDVECIVDSSGMRMRQHRRNGHRLNLPSLQSLPKYECGCEVPCFAEVPIWSLVSEYSEFAKISKDLRPRHKENCFLLNRLYDPLTNSTVKICNKALAVLYNVSESLIADVRRVLDSMCSGITESHAPLTESILRYRYDRRHPINRIPSSVREKVENYLDFILRPDPAAGRDELRACRVYSPEINTQEKLRMVIMKELELEDSLDSELSASTVHRMVKEYLKRRNYAGISFTQSDHNACPHCKSLQYAILQFSHESLALKREMEHLQHFHGPLTEVESRRLEKLPEMASIKHLQEKSCLQELRNHNGRDMRIRLTLKKWCDHFRYVENSYRIVSSRGKGSVASGWKSGIDRASITHQDDMTKVDLPHFAVTASADITRWRFDVNAHINAVTNDALVFSHEQGMGPKNASLIVEEILLEHVLRCRGESIKIIVSDNAAVGKNWLTTIALPQYMVDQGLAEVVVMVFLENNHGKWLADMLFGQFQTRRRRSTILGIDDMLDGFQAIKRRNGTIEGFALNPLSSVDFAQVFESLGYETTPPKGFYFNRRNIHFSAACSPGVKKRLPVEVQDFLGPILPDDRGMVRISTEPPGHKAQCELPYEDRYFDVPAARTNLSWESSPGQNESVEQPSLTFLRTNQTERVAPLVVPLGKPFTASGYGVVSSRTAQHVGYNGIEFSKLDACAEMRQTASSLVRRAWPEGLISPFSVAHQSDELINGQESMKCAPMNWVVRRPVSFYCKDETDWKARYPPQNLLNAKFRQGPRERSPWKPTATYYEPPFPIVEGTAACNAMKALAEETCNPYVTLDVLHILREVFRDMGEEREFLSDPWLQRRASTPSQSALARYQDELQIYTERESGHPLGVISVKKAFRLDEEVRRTVEQKMMDSAQSSGGSKSSLETLNSMYEEAERRPGGLDRFRYQVEKDQERYAREMKKFREWQKQYDKDRGIAPESKQHLVLKKNIPL